MIIPENVMLAAGINSHFPVFVPAAPMSADTMGAALIHVLDADRPEKSALHRVQAW
ncbi:MAG: hypothetical protein IPJ27_21480 [Candidatus Accumulibacter sp.]|uniref:Uncharacterized protein n=1 Tax=Candidatus Accumulibacter proximus TaxID=2954385 RepID=A0A935UIY0_9PROT|nr:hypothetical protein [Candidatus Accumulibacter proximus]